MHLCQVSSSLADISADIERYAIFGNYEGKAAEGDMITDGKLNEVGIAYRDAA